MQIDTRMVAIEDEAETLYCTARVLKLKRRASTLMNVGLFDLAMLDVREVCCSWCVAVALCVAVSVAVSFRLCWMWARLG